MGEMARVRQRSITHWRLFARFDHSIATPGHAAVAFLITRMRTVRADGRRVAAGDTRRWKDGGWFLGSGTDTAALHKEMDGPTGLGDPRPVRRSRG